ncbi:MAG: pitrilysin family protein [Gemmatimonadota bacterium]|nr:pitrilysin family protein [Gemmatimonadota bacterium]
MLAPGRVRRHRLANGLTVLVAPDDRVPVVAIVTWVSAGYFDEPDAVVGVSHVLEHMYFKGTPTRGVGDIARETKGQGGYLNAGTIYDHTSYYTVLPASGFAAGLEIQADAYANSLIDADELAREIEVIVEEAKRKADSPHAVASESLFELLHDRHRMRRWRIGREPGLRALTRGDVHGFYRTYYRPANTVLAIAGDVDADEAIRLAERHYGGLDAASVPRDRGPMEPPRRDFRLREWSGDITQAEVAIGWRTPPLASPDAPRLDVVASVLSAGRSSRLFRAVRDRQLASSISAYQYVPVDLGVFVMHATTRPERALDCAAAAWHQLARIRAGDVTEGELERVRRVHEAQWLRRLDTAEGRANHLASWEALGGWELAASYFDAVQRVDAAALADVASRHLAPDAAAVVVYRPHGAPAVCSGPEALREALDAADPAPLVASVSGPAAPVVTAAASVDGETAGVRVYRTAAGVPILVKRTPRAPIAYAGVFVRAGAETEPAPWQGASTLMTRASLKGTASRSAARIAEESERLGASLGAGAGAEMLHWTLSVPVTQLDGALALLADVVQGATLSDDAVENERVVALAQLAQLRDDMYRYPLHLAARAAWGDHPYARSALGTEPTLGALTSDALRQWHRDTVLTGDQVVVIVGDAEPDLLAAQAAGAFAALRPAPHGGVNAPEWTAGASASEHRDKAQTALALLYPGPARDDARRFAAGLLGGVASGLGGRFFEALRDRQSLAYTVIASPIVRPLAGLFAVYIATSPEKEEAARAGLLAQIDALRDAPVTHEELHRARTYALGTWAIRQESGGAVMSDIADAWLFGTLRELADVEERLRAVSVADLHGVAVDFLDPSRRVEGAVLGVAGRRV